jgi:hypothetical protein
LKLAAIAVSPSDRTFRTLKTAAMPRWWPVYATG